MNMLSLRINSLKCNGSSDRNAHDIFKFTIDESLDKDQIELLFEINNSKSFEEQLRKLKSFIGQIEKVNERLKKKISDWCVSLFFKEKVKHPVKLAIQNVFNRSSQRDVIVSSFGEKIRLLCNLTRDDEQVLDDTYHFISSLNEASQNFIFAKEAMANERETIITLLCRFVNDRKFSISSLLSPARKNEISGELHVALQLSVFMMNYFNRDDQDNIQFRKEIKTLYYFNCKELLTHEELPLDTKNICGLAIVEHQNIFPVDGLSRFPSSNVHETLAIAHGEINSKFAWSPKEQSTRFMIILDHLQRLSKDNNALDPTIILAIARIYAQASKKSIVMLKRAKEKDNLADCSSYDLRKFTMPFVLNHIEHHIDSVRHLAKETLENIIEFAVGVEEIDHFVEEYHSYRDFKIRCLFLSLALPKTNPLIHFNQLKRLYGDLTLDLCRMDCINQNSFKLFDVLSEICKKSSTYDEWLEKFVFFLLKYDDDIHNTSIQDVMENTLFRRIEKDKTAMQKIIEARGSIKHKHRFYRVISRANKIGAFDDKNSSEELWRELLPYQEIKDAMVDGDDRIRNSAFSLIVDSKKTTQEFIAFEFDCIFHFLKYNINVQSPSSRQNIFGLLKNFFERIQSILQIIKKKNDEQKINFYFNFLRNLQLFCLENLFEGANFSRRVLSLRILFYVLEATKQHFSNKAEDIWDQAKFDILMKVFNDSYEANKGMMIEIMHLIPRNVILSYSTLSLDQIRTLMTSIKPPENLTATYLCEFYATFIEDDIYNTRVVHYAYWKTLNWCIGLLIEGLTLAEKSLIVASYLNPLYGLIFTIRHLISKLNLATMTSDVEWRKFFSSLIPLSRRLTEVVAPVVNSSAPEGILPNEQIDGLDDTTAEEWQQIIEKTTPQIILLCSWRTIKETSLLLGDISSRAPVTNKSQKGLLTVDEILDISDHFLELLSNTKHRGAFEQCFLGFSQLCMRLWTSKEERLHQLPSKELHSLMKLISGNSKDSNELLTMKNLCSTRRSAGLPFVIQALITSELKIGKNQNFHFVMENLIACARNGECLETRTHSLNILRALFRCSDLGEPIFTYIEDGIRIAIQGYESSSWIERNSSTLLFASLMVRIFGVQKTKDDEQMNIRNKMTGRIFFLRYPKLYDFFLEELEKASKFVERAECNSKLHPLLLILNRLYPSSLEGSESNLKVEKFIPHVTQCSGCVEVQTRVLCAKFIANVLRPEMLMLRIYELIDILSTYDSLSSNFCHGLLLQILFLIKKLSSDVPKVANLMEKLSTIVSRFKKRLICYATILDMHLELIIKYPTLLRDPRVSMFITNCNDLEITEVFGVPMVAKKMVLLEFCKCDYEILDFTGLIPLSTSEVSNYKKFLPNNKIKSNDLAKHHITHVLLNMIIMSSDYDYARSMAEDYEISKQELEIGKLAKSTWPIFKESSQLSNDYFIQVKTLDILALQKKRQNLRYYENESIDQEMLQNRINSTIEKALRSPEHQKKSLLKHVYNSIQDLTTFENINFDFLPEISTDSSTHVKSVALDILHIAFCRTRKSILLDTVFNLTKTVLLLLMDDETEIREKCARLVDRKFSSYNDFENPQRKVHPYFAQEKFLENLGLFFPAVGRVEILSIVAMIAIDVEGHNSLEENIADFKVFDKSEVNIFSESFVVMRKCRQILKTSEEQFSNVTETMKNFTWKKSSLSSRMIENFVKDVMNEKSTSL